MKILATIWGDDVAARFDLTTEVVIVESENGNLVSKPRTILLPRPSAEELCGLILKEDISIVICGGIEESHYEYLLWKKVKVLDGVIGAHRQAVQLAASGELKAGAILRPNGTQQP